MSICKRFDSKVLLQLERGEPLDEHFESCDDCLASRRAYEHLQRAIAVSAPDLEPSPEWRAHVWNMIEEDRGGRFRWLPRQILAPVAAIAMLVVVSMVWWQALSPDEPFLQSTVVAQGAAVRGEDAHPGDVLQLRANTGGSAHADLRIYFNSAETAMSCSAESPCRRSGDTIEADFVLASVGSYQAALFLSDQPLPAPGGDLDQDAGAVIDSGGEVKLADRVPVR